MAIINFLVGALSSSSVTQPNNVLIEAIFESRESECTNVRSSWTVHSSEVIGLTIC